jgi:glycosyltransferase involved in cell wall biosynthesis
MKLSLVLLTMNEAEGSKALFDKIPWDYFDSHLVVDARSTDNTREFFESKNIPVLTQQSKGLGNAVIEAMDAIKGDAAVFFHPDGNMDPADTLKFKDYFDQGYEFIVASRMLKESFNEEDCSLLKPRKWANICFARIASILWRKPGAYRGTDPVNGFRGITRAAFKKMDITSTDCSIDYQMLIRAYKKDIKMTEFPTIESNRIAGETKFGSISTGLIEVKLILKELFC